jgi:hypothetical protein
VLCIFILSSTTAGHEVKMQKQNYIIFIYFIGSNEQDLIKNCCFTFMCWLNVFYIFLGSPYKSYILQNKYI